MKKKSLLINCLSAAFLGASLLTASCSGGASSGSNTSSTQPPIGGVASDMLSFTVGDFGGLIAPYLLSSVKNYIFNGQWGTDKDIKEQRNAELVNQIESQIAIIQGDLAYSNTALESIIMTLANEDVNNNNYSINLATQQISNLNAQALRLMSLALNDKTAYKQAENILLLKSSAYSSSEQPATLSAAVMESVTTYLTTHKEYARTILPVFSTNAIDNIEVSLSCFPATACPANYNIFAGTEAAYISEYTVQNYNPFYAVKNYYAAVEVVYLQMAAALTRAYILDQLRYYLFIHINPAGTPSKNSLITAPSIILDQPSLMIPGNYNVGVQALQTNYTNQINSLTNQMQSAKQDVFNNYFPNIADPSGTLNSQCNFSESGIDRIPLNIESTITPLISNAAESYGNSYSWDGSQYLRLTCGSNNQESMTSTVNVTGMCALNNSTYQLQESNGYVGCALGQGFESNINKQSIKSVYGHTPDGFWYGNNITNFLNDQNLTFPNSPFLTFYDNSVSVDTLDGWWPYNIGGNFFVYFNVNPYNMSQTSSSPIQSYAYYSYTYVGGNPQSYPSNSNLPTGGGTPCWQNDAYICVYPGSQYSGAPAGANNGNFVDFDTWEYWQEPTADQSWSYINDGYHAYIIGITNVSKSSSQSIPLVLCLPNDLNCTQGWFANHSQQGFIPNGGGHWGPYEAVIFSNGDMLTMTSQDYSGSPTGDYLIQTWYGTNQVSSPIKMTGHSIPIIFGNQVSFQKVSN